MLDTSMRFGIKRDSRMYQICPVCGERQQTILHGLAPNIDSSAGGHVPVMDKGYSFCNCNNVFFTDKKNLEYDIYDQGYSDKYESPHAKQLYKNLADKYALIIRQYRTEIKDILDIGCVTDSFMDAMSEHGFSMSGFDVLRRESKHPVFFSAKGYDDCFLKRERDDSYDVIWASHVFEHFTRPHVAMERFRLELKNGGLLFIAMPDPYFIDWSNPYAWGHWNIREHHILWDRDSFVTFAENLGFKCIYRERNAVGEFMSFKDYHLLFRKV